MEDEKVIQLGYLDYLLSQISSHCDVQFTRVYQSVDTNGELTKSGKLVLHGIAEIQAEFFHDSTSSGRKDSFQFMFSYASSDGKNLTDAHVEITYWLNFMKFLTKHIDEKIIRNCLGNCDVKFVGKDQLLYSETFRFNKKHVFQKKYLKTGRKTPPEI
ncbi:hypothetical protein [Leptospira bouyouniensis]|uniref:hypothetical protein n=1 Tax=Leptospira bouyouniensis TaxID=2484911 RepID=UPI001090C3D7|nr:hypothetical protein [Leptospira bouyouniensis]TGM88276.1 hypothetical protein EHQ99_00225 [Leptospira bouyouniensis]